MSELAKTNTIYPDDSKQNTGEETPLVEFDDVDEILISIGKKEQDYVNKLRGKIWINDLEMFEEKTFANFIKVELDEGDKHVFKNTTLLKNIREKVDKFDFSHIPSE